MEDVSPAKWHLAHTSWFYETFILKPMCSNYKEFSKNFSYLFNSYYDQVGDKFHRPSRGFLSRPTVKEVYLYRRHVDENIIKFFTSSESCPEAYRRLKIGIEHEKQHQELLLTDLKFNFYQNPLLPALLSAEDMKSVSKLPCADPAYIEWTEGSVCEIGHDEDLGFCYDNELPRHKVYVNPFRISKNLVTNGEYLEFIQSGGYSNSALWLSDGWAMINEQGITRPLYWNYLGEELYEYTLSGNMPLDLQAPVSHISHYEANAYARFKALRLPTEQEWEVIATSHLAQEAQDLLMTRWQWCESSYLPYPGYEPEDGALGEYNGKFMSAQMVLRGGSDYTPEDHLRISYRNFFPSKARWQRTGIRLAQSI